jgi:hypothetical protein
METSAFNIWVKAERLVEQHWDRIMLVARALGERGRLDGDEVAALMEDAPRISRRLR